MKKILLYLLLLPSLGFGQSLYEYQNLSKYRVRVGELVLNGEKIRPVASDSGQVLQFDGTLWKNTTKNGESDPFYKIDSLALNRSMRAFVRDSGSYVWWKDTTQTTGAGIASRFDNSLKQNLLVNSAGLAGALNDETGTLKSVFSNEPTFTSKITIDGNVIINTNGTSALLSTKKANNTDGFNVFFGGGGQSVIYDGVNSFSGSYNTANGVNALYSNTTGYSNTANGVDALYSNTTGYQNTANGVYALRSNTTGYYNTANGVDALYSNTTGNNNVAIGFEALQTGTGTTRNVIVGASAYRSGTGSDNVVIGGLAGYSSGGTTGNIYIGTRAGFTTSTGSNNVAIGYYSLYTNSTGTSNTALGLNAGYSTTGSSNVFMGYRAGYKETGSNKYYVAQDSTSWANGMASGSKLLMYADQSNAAKSNHFLNIFAKVSIGAAKNPTEMLSVAGNAAITGSLKSGTGSIADNDTSPSVANYNTFIYAGSANPVSIDALDDHVVGCYYTIIGNSNTYTITVIDGTPAGGDSFNLAGGNWVGGSQDVLLLYCIAADAFIEVSRSDN